MTGVWTALVRSHNINQFWLEFNCCIYGDVILILNGTRTLFHRFLFSVNKSVSYDTQQQQPYMLFNTVVGAAACLRYVCELFVVLVHNIIIIIIYASMRLFDCITKKQQQQKV